MQVEKCYFLSNLPRQAASSPESGRESNMFRAEILYFFGFKCLQMGDFGLRLPPRQPVCGVHFRRGYPSFRGKNLPDPAQSSPLSRSDQWHAVTASFLGWTLDAFDFFVLVFLMDTLAAHFRVDKSKIVETLFFTLVMRPVGALIFGLLADRYGRRKPLMANVVFFSVIELLCGFAPNYTVFLILRTIYGIGMGGEWGVGASLAMENAPAKWRGVLSGIVQRILRWLFAGRGGGALHFAGLGMARNVLGGRGACAAGVLYSVSRAGIGWMAATSRCHDRRDRARGERALENL